MHMSRLVKQGRNSNKAVRSRKKKCHRAPESICVTVSEKESVTNLTGTTSFWSIFRGDVGVGGEMVNMIKSYKYRLSIGSETSKKKSLPLLGRL